MRFSIIIPVYNVEKYIGKCLDTVMHQTFSDYEVIVVNDETPDNSMTIVQQYVDRFPEKIRVFHQKNTRQGGARNNGVQHARGEYILFVDSDDYVALNMLEIVDAHLRREPCDVLVFRNAMVTESGKRLPMNHHGDIAPGLYHPKETPGAMLLATGPVNKAFRRAFYLGTEFRFPEKLLYEDAVTRVLYAAADSLLICEDVLYYYVQSQNSAMRQAFSEKMLDILTVTDLVLDMFQQRDLYQTFREPLECSLIYGIQAILDPINLAQPDHPLQEPMADYMASRFPNYHSNPCISTELKRALDCIIARDFRKYHFQILRKNQLKDWILRIPGVAALNTWRKSRRGNRS